MNLYSATLYGMPAPAIGFALGLERLLALLEAGGAALPAQSRQSDEVPFVAIMCAPPLRPLTRKVPLVKFIWFLE